jgi:cyclic pyranopterin phosphate synthase
MTLLVDPQHTSVPLRSGDPAARTDRVAGRRQLIDSFGRRIADLRISVTDRCNFRCVYCMPEEGMQWLKRESILSFDEIERLARIAVDLGIEEIRLTGGEPTLRPNLPDLVARLSQLPLRSLSLTTNGFLLRSMARPLAEAGLKRINVSLDTLQHDRFHQIARRHGLDEVLAGLEELERYPSIAPIKVNVVAMRDFTEDEVVAFAQLARREPYVIRFIEFMPLDADGNWQRERVLTGNEIKTIIEREFMPMRPLETEPSSTSRTFTFADGVGELGFINPVSQPFCGTCNRLRLTADGQIRTCLFSIDEWDLRGALRSGASDEAVAQVLIDAVAHKELKHKINEGAAFQRASRSMSQIGG